MAEATNGHERPPFYIDISNGTLLVGSASYDQHIEAGGQPYDVYPLKEVLLGAIAVSADTTLVERVDVTDWKREDYISYGRWLHSLVTEPEAKRTAISESVLDRAAQIGIGPSVKRINFRERFGKLSNFYSEIEVEPQRSERYANYTRQDLADYVGRTFSRLLSRRAERGNHIRTLTEQLNRLAANGDGPSAWLIAERGLTISLLLEMKGWFVPRNSWGEDDYIAWGVKFMLANDGRVPQTPHFHQLSPISRGPALATIYRLFGLKKYQGLVQEAYETESASRHLAREQKLDLIKREIEEGSLPNRLVERCSDENELIGAHGRYKVLELLVPQLDTKMRIQNAVIQRPSWFVRAIQRANPTITTARIEEAALLLDVFDSIWPMDEFMRTLKITGSQ